MGRMQLWKQYALARREGDRGGIMRVRALTGVQKMDWEGEVGCRWAKRAAMMERQTRALRAVLVDIQVYFVDGGEVFLGEVRSLRAEMEAGEK